MPLAAWALSEEGTPLPRHPDARLTTRGRAPPCERVDGGMRVSDAAAMAGAGVPGSRSTPTPGRWRAYPGAAGTGPSGAAAGRGGAPGRRSRAWPSMTTAGSPTTGGRPTRGRGRPAPSWSGRSRSAGPRGHRGARDGRRRARLPVGRARHAARGPRDGARAREALRPLAERQGRAHEQDARAGVAVREGAGERGGQGLRPRPLPGALQSEPPARRVRGPALDVTHHRRKQRLGT